MSAQKGRPWCKSAGMYINIKTDNREAPKQCDVCRNLIYVGCPEFDGDIKFALRKTEDYVRWMRGEPIADDSPLFDNPKSTKPRPSSKIIPDCSEQTTKKEGEL